MRNAGLEKSQAGIKINRRNINHLRYADDTTLMAESEEELKRLLITVKEESEKVGFAEMPKEDIVFWACVYKCICHITSAPDHLVQQARDWLHSHGMSEQIWPEYH